MEKATDNAQSMSGSDPQHVVATVFETAIHLQRAVASTDHGSMGPGCGLEMLDMVSKPRSSSLNTGEDTASIDQILRTHFSRRKMFGSRHVGASVSVPKCLLGSQARRITRLMGQNTRWREFLISMLGDSMRCFLPHSASTLMVSP